MSDTYASVVLGGDARNAEFLGVMVAWHVTNHLIAPNLESRAGRTVARVRMQDMTGAGFLTTELDGELRPTHLSEEGQRFVEAYFLSGQFRSDFDAAEFDGDNEWERYDQVAPSISAAFRKFRAPAEKPSTMGKILQFPRRK